MNFFEEIAKYRALRRLWASVMRDRFGAQDPRSMMLRTHTQTAGSTLTLQQPENNIVRAAIQALAAALGGVQSMALSCFDEAIAIPTQHAQTLAVRTQQMLQHEFGVTDVADPMGGSWYVEHLTDELERRGARADGRVRAAGRRGGGDRAGRLPAADRRRGVPQGAADRVGRGRGGRRQRVRRRHGGGAGAVRRSAAPGVGAAREAGAAAGAPGRRRGRGPAWRRSRRPRAVRTT